MSNIFEQAAKQMRGSSFVIQVMFVAALMFGMRLVLVSQDILSSRLGFEQLEEVFDIVPASNGYVYWVISAVPTVGQMGFAYLYMYNTDRKWALVVAVWFMLIDLVADVQHRSGNNFMLLAQDGVNVNWDTTATWISIGISLGWYTIGSELFFTAGGGLLLAAFPDAVEAWVKLEIRIRVSVARARAKLKKARKEIKEQFQEQPHVGGR